MKTFTEGWEKIHAERVWGGYPCEEIIRFVARNYYKNPHRKQVKILDFGCGAGNNTWYLAREGFDVYAFDGSPSAIARVRERLDYEGLNANVLVSDAGELKYEDAFFDCIVDSVCIQNNKFDDIKVMYKKCFQMLKPGGKIISTAFSTQTTGYGTGDRIEEDTYKNVTVGALKHDSGTINHFWTEDSIREVLKGCGFTNINVERISRTDHKFLIDMLIVDGEKKMQ